MAASTLMLSLLLLVASGAAGAANKALDDVCAVLGGYYVTPEACASALCPDPSSSPCAAARDAHAVAALATSLAAANATAARDSVRAGAAAAAGEGAAAAKKAALLSCLQLYTGAAAALEWAAGSVAAGRYPGAREVLQAARYVPSGCDGMAMVAGAAVPPENGGFDAMVTVAHAVVASLSKGY